MYARAEQQTGNGFSNIGYWTYYYICYLLLVIIMPDKNCVNEVRIERAKVYFIILAVTFVAIGIFLKFN